jgi:hypothetical protein
VRLSYGVSVWSQMPKQPPAWRGPRPRAIGRRWLCAIQQPPETIRRRWNGFRRALPTNRYPAALDSRTALARAPRCWELYQGPSGGGTSTEQRGEPDHKQGYPESDPHRATPKAFNACFPRRTFSMMASGSAVQMKGLGASLVSRKKRLMAARRSTMPLKMISASLPMLGPGIPSY